MDTAAIQWIISIVLGIIPWIVPDLPWYWKIIITLGIALLSLSISWFRLSQNLKESQQVQKDLEKKHKALASQFEDKNVILSKYCRALRQLSLILHLALQNTKEAKLEDIYRAYLIALEELTDGGNRDDP